MRTEFIKSSTKKGQYVLGIASRNIGTDISQVYFYPSEAKKSAFWDNVMIARRNNDGVTWRVSNFHICSKTVNFFVVSWEIWDIDTDTLHYVIVNTGRTYYVVNMWE